MRHLITIADLTTIEIERIFSISEDLKAKFTAGLREPLLPGRVMALLFEKPSLRTRASFEAAMAHLGGTSMFLGGDTGFGKGRESLADFGRVLSEYVDVIVVRANKHETVGQIAEHSSCSVINGLTDFSHPCQAIADLFTIRELVGKLEGHTLAWIGDANNVARSLAIGCGKLGIRMVMATPKKYQWDHDGVAWIKQHSPGLDLTEKEARAKAFAPYQVNAKLMSQAQRGAFFMHCLPAHRGEEVTDEVLDGPQSVVVQQAANRMHAQKGLLAWLLAQRNG
jgi:ornithine carbamoyltransferase